MPFSEEPSDLPEWFDGRVTRGVFFWRVTRAKDAFSSFWRSRQSSQGRWPSCAHRLVCFSWVRQRGAQRPSPRRMWKKNVYRCCAHLDAANPAEAPPGLWVEIEVRTMKHSRAWTGFLSTVFLVGKIWSSGVWDVQTFLLRSLRQTLKRTSGRVGILALFGFQFSGRFYEVSVHKKMFCCFLLSLLENHHLTDPGSPFFFSCKQNARKVAVDGAFSC